MLRDKNSYAANPLKIFANSKICAVDFLYSPLKNYKKISKYRMISISTLLILVGAERFELPTLWSQTRCATRLRYAPNISIYTLEIVKSKL